MKKYFFILILTIGTLSLAEQSELQQQVRKGIDLLYSNQIATDQCTETHSCPENINKEILVEQALKFKENYDQILSNYQFKDLTWKKQNDQFVNFKEFQFSSPIQKENSPANTVYGYVYTPPMPEGCQVKFPATLLVHHVANDISDEQLFASMATKMNKGVVMIIYLPEYGPRKKNQQAPPFAADINEFKNSLLQSLVDIRVAGELLKTLDHVDQKQIQVGGLSLGALLTAISAGIDPFFDRYLLGLGGGDLANAMTLDKNKAKGIIKDALANINWNVDFARKEMSSFDALTWAYTVKNKKITILNAENDELVDKNKSILKLTNAYKENGSNTVLQYEHKGSHVPDAKELGKKEAIFSYLKVIYRVFGFLGDNKSAEINQCRQQNY